MSVSYPRRPSVPAEKMSANSDPEMTPSGTPDMATLLAEAQAATEAEHALGFRKSFKLYPAAVCWSLALSTCLIMEGFDIVLLNQLFAFPTFQKKFGVEQADGSYQLTTQWQSGLANGAWVGEICGLFASGVIAERYGYRYTLMGALALVAAFLAIIFTCQSLPQLLIGEILVGIPWGVFQTLTTTYAADVCPLHLRAYLTTYNNLCWVIGQFLASGVLVGMLNNAAALGDWSFRIPWALQWIWPVPLIVAVWFAPESPYWLVRTGKIDRAKNSLRRLTNSKHATEVFNSAGIDASAVKKFSIDDTISMMIYTNELEKEATAGTSYKDLFRDPVSRRRTEIVCVTWAVQALCGASFMGFSTYFYEQAGMSVDKAFNMSLGQYAIGAVGTVLSWFSMRYFGRRTLYLYGQLAMTLLLLAIGITGLVGGSAPNGPASWVVGSLLLIYTFIYDATVGPVCYSLVAELSSTRLRNKSVVMARNVYNICSIVVNIITPLMLNPTAWNWGAKSGMFFAGTCGLCALWTFFRLPEPKDRTYGELEVLFAQGVSARKFSKTLVGAGLEENDAYDEKADRFEAYKAGEGDVTTVEKVASL